MELSEALKAVRYVRPDGEFLLFGHIWPPTAVMLGKAPYPTREQVCEQVREAGARLVYLDPANLPALDGATVPANVYVLGAALGHTALGRLLDADEMAELVQRRWKRGAERNALAFQAGLEARVE